MFEVTCLLDWAFILIVGDYAIVIICLLMIPMCLISKYNKCYVDILCMG